MDHPSPDPQDANGGFGYVGAGQTAMDTDDKTHGGGHSDPHRASKNLPGGYASIASATPASEGPPSSSTMMYDPYQGIAPAANPHSFQQPAATAQHVSGMQSPPQPHDASFRAQDPLLPTYHGSPPAQYQQAPQAMAPLQMTPQQMQQLQGFMQQPQQPQFRPPQ